MRPVWPDLAKFLHLDYEFFKNLSSICPNFEPTFLANYYDIGRVFIVVVNAQVLKI